MPDKPAIQFDNIPAELKAIPQWVLWRYEDREGQPTKVPYQTDGRRASVTDSATWTEYEIVWEVADGFSGIGFVITPDLGITGIDLDKCVRANGRPELWACDVVDQLSSYSEISPSGKGIRIWVRGTLPTGRRRTGQIEMYISGRFLTVTGNQIPGTPCDIRNAQEALTQFYLETFPAAPERKPRIIDPYETSTLAEQDILRVAFGASNGAAIEALFRGDTSSHEFDDSRADAALVAHLAFYAGPNGGDIVDALFRQSGLYRPKWDEKHGATTYGARTITRVYEQTTAFYAGAGDYVDLQGNRGDLSTNQGNYDTDSEFVNESLCHPLNLKNGNLSTPADVPPSQKEFVNTKPEISEKTASDWPEPMALDEASLEIFPLISLPPVLSRYVADVAKTVQVPIDMAALAAVSVVCFAASRRWQVRIGRTHTEPLNIYVACAAEPGSRKSPCLEAMIFPIRAAEEELMRIAKGEIAQRTEQRRALESWIDQESANLKKGKSQAEITNRANELAAKRNELPEIPVMPQLLAEDITPEQLVSVLVEQSGSIALMSSEGGIFSILAGRYSEGQPNLDVILKGHDAEPYKTDRRSRNEYVKACRIGMLMMVQPEVLTSAAGKKEFRQRGALGRILYGFPQDLRGSRLMSVDSPGFDVDIRYEYERAVKRILLLPPVDAENPYDRHTVKMGREALAKHVKFSNEIELRQVPGGDLHHMSDWASKLAGRIARIATAFHCLTTEEPTATPIDEHTMLQAWSIGEYLIPHAKYAFGQMTGSAAVVLAVRFLTWIRRQTEPTFRSRDCYRFFHRHCDSAEANKALNVLVNYGYLRRQTEEEGKKKPGPKEVVFEVHPSLSQKNADSC